MEHDLAPKIFQLFSENLVNSPTIDYDSHLDLKNFRHNIAVPELIRGSLAPPELFIDSWLS